MALRMAWRCAGSAASGAPAARIPPRTGSRPGVSERARKEDEMNFPDFCFTSEFLRKGMSQNQDPVAAREECRVR
jgi:hypothetical protein